MKHTTAGILFILLITAITLGVSRYLVNARHEFKEWQQFSSYELDYIVRCVEHQPFFTCTENIHEMRQIGIVP